MLSKASCLLLLIMVSGIADCQQAPSKKLTNEDFRIQYHANMVYLRQSYFEIRANRDAGGLGTPVQSNRNRVENRGSLFVVHELHYPGLILAFSYSSIERIEITDNQSKTARGISLGMSDDNVASRYGEADGISSVGTGAKKMVYRLEGDSILITSYEIAFEFTNRKITRIILKANYDESKILTLEDFSIGSGINHHSYHVLQNIQEIQRDFPLNPRVTTEIFYKGEPYEFEEHQYRYDSIVFFLRSDSGIGDIVGKDEVRRIVIDGDGGSTRRGIVVGDSSKKVLDAYGVYDKLTMIEIEGQEVLNYVFQEFGSEEVFGRVFERVIDGLFLDFYIEDDKVKKIELSFSMPGD